MTNKVLIRNGAGEVREYRNVLYCEEGTRARDNTEGIAIQYADDTSELVVRGTILGVYPEDADHEFDHKYFQLVN